MHGNSLQHHRLTVTTAHSLCGSRHAISAHVHRRIVPQTNYHLHFDTAQNHAISTSCTGMFHARQGWHQASSTLQAWSLPLFSVSTSQASCSARPVAEMPCASQTSECLRGEYAILSRCAPFRRAPSWTVSPAGWTVSVQTRRIVLVDARLAQELPELGTSFLRVASPRFDGVGPVDEEADRATGVPGIDRQ